MPLTKKPNSQNTSRPPGVISHHEIYTLEEFSLRTGLKSSALRQARRAGLRVFYAHGHAFISGREWNRYLAAQQSAHSQSQECTDI
jgi:hypothetical protein